MVDSTNFVPVAPALEAYPPNVSVLEADAGFTEFLFAQGTNVLQDSPTSSIARIRELTNAGRYAFDKIPEQLADNASPDAVFMNEERRQQRQTFTHVSNHNAKAQVAAAGVQLDLGDGPISQEALDILIERALRRQERDITIAGYNPSMAMQLTTAVGVSLLDPLNIAAGFVPVVGQARSMRMLTNASGMGGRSLARAKIGAIEGLAGSAMVEPLIAAAATQEGRDYTTFHSLQNLMFGAGLGSGMHMGFGAAAEKVMGRTFARTPTETPNDIVDRLPYEVKEATLRAAVADIIAGRDVTASDVIDHITRQDPDLAAQIQFVSTLRRDGPEIDNTLERVEYWKGKLSGTRRSPEKTSVEDFMTWVRSHGGVRDTDGVLEQALDEALPRTAMIKRRGLKKTDRGVEFEDMFKRAVEAGFVRTRAEFVDAFKAGQKSSPLRPVLRETDEAARLEAETILAEEKAYIEAAQRAAGVDPNAKPETRARAIVGREQHVIAAERARISTAIDRLIARRDALARGEAPPPPPKEEQSAQTRAEIEAGQVREGEEAPETGDTVHVLDETGAPTAISDAGPEVKVKNVFTDPNYGTYVFFDESSGLGAGGIPVGRVKVIKKAAKAEVEGTLSKTITDETQARADEFATMRAKRAETGTMPERKMPEWGAAPREASAKLKNIRQDIDELFPNTAESGEYYLSMVMSDHFMGRYEFNHASLQKYLNQLISKKELTAVNADTGKKIATLDSSFFELNTRLDKPDVLLKFKSKAEKRKGGKGGTPMRDKKTGGIDPNKEAKVSDLPPGVKLGKLTPEEQAAAAADYAKLGTANRRVETPPAEKEALTSKELDDVTARYQQLEADTAARLERILPLLPPDTAVTIRAQLSKVDRDAQELLDVYETAVQCLLKPL